ncbi:MAG: flagellar hook capping FlgD N-terminal domain-containing protein [Steroidobacteraceae bacterium]
MSTINSNPSTTPVGAATTASTGTGSASGSAGSGIAGLTMNDFLTLMTAQLQNQDPLNPADSNEFLSQLSELSTVQGISQMNTTMTALSTSLISSQALASASLVGQNVLAPATSASYTSGSTLSGAVQVPTGANSVMLTITNAGGALVDQIPVSATSGLQNFTWNGTTSNGSAAPSGTYNVAATAAVGAANQSASTLLAGTVQSVSLGTSGTGVTLNTPQLGSVALSNVQQIN